ncbi:hypothetical protein ES288_D12G236000v1 [Gossypium darwinii]|uniref:Uncharacterized protein n=1 Tax=Gossypium darwinii TaxID=34276 RepID=A0A5D2AE42_GOSDA|nr:hypothetical protein ES288_D12G236000v1 [Gossypium darwinii]
MPSNGWALTADRPSTVPPRNRRPKKRSKRVFKSPASRRLESRVLEPPRAPGLGLTIPSRNRSRRRRTALRRRGHEAFVFVCRSLVKAEEWLAVLVQGLAGGGRPRAWCALRRHMGSRGCGSLD